MCVRCGYCWFLRFDHLSRYSRWLPEENRREYWWETVRRAVEYNCSLVKSTTRREAEELFENIFYLRQFLSGRTFWVGGTDVAKHYPMANYNCSFQVIDKFFLFFDGVPNHCYLIFKGSLFSLGLCLIKIPS